MAIKTGKAVGLMLLLGFIKLCVMILFMESFKSMKGNIGKIIILAFILVSCGHVEPAGEGSDARDIEEGNRLDPMDGYWETNSYGGKIYKMRMQDGHRKQFWVWGNAAGMMEDPECPLCSEIRKAEIREVLREELRE